MASKAGLALGIRFHDLCHTAITLMLERGEELKKVATTVGDKEETILRVYAHVTPKMRKSLTVTMDRLLPGPSASLQYSSQYHDEDQAEEDR